MNGGPEFVEVRPGVYVRTDEPEPDEDAREDEFRARWEAVSDDGSE